MRWLSGISARLLIVTVIVVMIVEIVIFVPSVAAFRKSFLEERLVRAEIAAVTVMTVPGGRPMAETEAALLAGSGALNIVVAMEEQRFLALSNGDIPMPSQTFDLREAGPLDLVVDAIGCLLTDQTGQVHRIVGRTPAGTYDRVEITMPASDLRAAMIDYGLRILQLSLIISVVTAGVVFLVVRRFVVAPLLDVVQGVERFHQDPTDAERVIQPGSGAGEVAEAERAIAAMQTEVLRALSERRRLAALGEAVAKINHDLRNMLAAGQLMTERLGHSEDPIVARVLPKLVASLDRAASLCNHTLAFGKAEERPPEPRAVAVEALLIDVVEGLGLMSEAPPSIATLPASHSGLGLGEVADAPVAEADDVPRSPRVLADGPVRIVSLLGPRLQVSADPDHLFRIFSNLLRNAAEAIRATGRPGCIEIGLAEGQAGDGLLCLLVRDDGPGLPNKALENLFRPFIGGARRGGTGLGLAIAADLARLQNGRLELISTATTGTVFGLTLPTAPTQSTVGALPLGTDVRRAAGQN